MVKNFTPEDICHIIETCAKVGVGRLKLTDIEISFRENFLYTPAQSYLNDPTENGDRRLDDRQLSPASPVSEQSQRASMVDPGLLEEARIADLMINDPAEYEREMISAHMRQDYDSQAAQDR